MELLLKCLITLFVASVIPLNSGSDDNEWYSERHTNEPRSDELVITTGADEGKPVTVSDCGLRSIRSRIVGGRGAKAGEFPWAALLYNVRKGEPFCGAVILNERWLITAAHCFKKERRLSDITVMLGMVDIEDGTAYKISKVIKHEKYNSDGMEVSDIALIKTVRAIRMKREGNVMQINGVCLPNSLEEPKGRVLTVVGWGRTGEDDDLSLSLKVVKLDIVDKKRCEKKFGVEMVGLPHGYTIYKSQLCAFTRYKDSCQGDSGGPAIETVNGRAVLVGVVSFGVGCATDFPGVYTKVSHYLDWIAENMS